jgi:hypothetical protein
MHGHDSHPDRHPSLPVEVEAVGALEVALNLPLLLLKTGAVGVFSTPPCRPSSPT